MASEASRNAFLYDAVALKTLLLYTSPEIQQCVMAELDKCDHLFRYDKMYQCHRSLDALIKMLNDMVEAARPQVLTVEKPKQGGSVKELSAVSSVLGISLVAEFIKQTPLYLTATEKSLAGKKLQSICETVDGWNPVSVDKQTGYGTYYRPEPGCAFHSFLVKGVVKAPLIALASVLLELDMYKEWYPMANLSEEIMSVGTFHKQSKFAVTIPGPIIANREVCLDGYGIDDLVNRKVVIVARGLEEDECLADGRPVPKVQKGNVRCGMQCCGFIVEGISPDTTKVTFMMNIDPRIPNIPRWLINWTSGKMMSVLLSQMSKAAEKSLDPKSKYAIRRQERKEVYDYMQKMVDAIQF
jgi:hypothetical protein